MADLGGTGWGERLFPFRTIFNKFEWEACAKKTRYIVHNLTKNSLKRLLWPVISKFSLRAESFTKTESF